MQAHTHDSSDRLVIELRVETFVGTCAGAGVGRTAARTAGRRDIYLKQRLKDTLVEHHKNVNRHRGDLPEVQNWKWQVNSPSRQRSRSASTPSPCG